MKIAEPAAAAAAILASLCGERIASIRYREIKYDDGKPRYVAADHHSLDYGLELHLESGRVVSFIWQWPVSFYLAIVSGDLSAEVTGEHACWDASATAPWPTLLHRPLGAARLAWFHDDATNGDYSLSVRLGIAPDSVVYVTLGVGDEPDDHVAVIFSDDLARRHGRFLATSGLLDY